MPDGPRSRASHRALLRSLGLSASIAIALAGCNKRTDRIEDPNEDLTNWPVAEPHQNDLGDTPADIRHWRDPATGCDYLVADFGWKPGGITPRLRADGTVDCPASGIETRSATDPKGRGPKGESSTAESGDAQGRAA